MVDLSPQISQLRRTLTVPSVSITLNDDMRKVAEDDIGDIRKLARNELEDQRKVLGAKRGDRRNLVRCETGNIRKGAGVKLAGDMKNVAEGGGMR